MEGGKELELTQFAIELQLSRRLERAEVEIVRRLSSSIGLVCPGGTRECVESNETIASAGQTKLVKPFFANGYKHCTCPHVVCLIGGWISCSSLLGQ